MNKVHVRRLLMLADLLEKIPDKQFNMSDWVGADWKGDPTFSCGTSACALGWATTIPALRKAGLRMNHTEGYPYLEEDADSFPSDVSEKIFGLTFKEEQHLFQSGWSLSAKQVSNKIRRFVANKERVVT